MAGCDVRFFRCRGGDRFEGWWSRRSKHPEDLKTRRRRAVITSHRCASSPTHRTSTRIFMMCWTRARSGNAMGMSAQCGGRRWSSGPKKGEGFVHAESTRSVWRAPRSGALRRSHRDAGGGRHPATLAAKTDGMIKQRSATRAVDEDRHHAPTYAAAQCSKPTKIAQRPRGGRRGRPSSCSRITTGSTRPSGPALPRGTAAALARDGRPAKSAPGRGLEVGPAAT